MRLSVPLGEFSMEGHHDAVAHLRTSHIDQWLPHDLTAERLPAVAHRLDVELEGLLGMPTSSTPLAARPA
jgi:hypothetical protein